MLSQGAQRRPCPRPEDPEFRRAWEGLSVFDNEEEIRDLGRNYRRRGRNWVLGEYIARLDVPDDAPITYVAPHEEGSGHWLLYGRDGQMLDESDTPMLLGWVTRVVHGPSTEAEEYRR